MNHAGTAVPFRHYALMDTREAALAELGQVFGMIAQEHHDRGQALPKDTTELVHA
jgi:hypothetical protein